MMSERSGGNAYLLVLMVDHEYIMGRAYHAQKAMKKPNHAKWKTRP